MVGHAAFGKTTLCQRFNGLEQTYEKTQALDVVYSTIHTPGEYLERRSHMHALIVTSGEPDVVLFVQNTSQECFMFSPGQASAFPIPVAGIVSKADLATEKELNQARELLELTGASPIFTVSTATGEGMEALIEFLRENK